jgi:hypothetical protein
MHHLSFLGTPRSANGDGDAHHRGDYHPIDRNDLSVHLLEPKFDKRIDDPRMRQCAMELFRMKMRTD